VNVPRVPAVTVQNGRRTAHVHGARERTAPEHAPVLDAERLEVYAVALEFQVKAAELALRGDAVLRDQLRRASLSCVLKIAEGAGRRSRAQKRHFYGIARGSAMESAAIVDVLRVRGLAMLDDCQGARALLVRIVQMLTRLERSIR
jgi:four helix bundle protein